MTQTTNPGQQDSREGKAKRITLLIICAIIIAYGIRFAYLKYQRPETIEDVIHGARDKGLPDSSVIVIGPPDDSIESAAHRIPDNVQKAGRDTLYRWHKGKVITVKRDSL